MGFTLLGCCIIKSKMDGYTCNPVRAPKKYAILVRMSLCDYVEGVERDGMVMLRFMKQVRIWTKVDSR
jgi:hypothetical protein